MFTVVLDACTLVPITLCDTLLRIAETGSYGVRWSATILDEVERTMVGKLGIPPDSAARRLGAMSRAFRFAEVHDHERLEGLLTNDPKDRHVLACAIAAQVHTIVTFNLKDFPQPALEPWGVEAVHPDQFLLNQLDLAPGHVTSAIEAMLTSSSRPPRTVDSVLGALARSGVPDFADELRRHVPLR
ncbi:PIN domain-containing protein [Brachybacterium paraconglomeratum]|uniref:PIN domain-containing protein n=1 Tax=Brachybacterium paraconglomeratum TaxID=173362 RepID=UPI0022B036F2|nr:PIN domain-containing protein [Brachybacterium paraconglomeratum]MCZ4327822.1 PIN domain-containing protein [Brachybacterium paraconglomeratum]